MAVSYSLRWVQLTIGDGGKKTKKKKKKKNQRQGGKKKNSARGPAKTNWPKTFAEMGLKKKGKRPDFLRTEL